MTWPRARYPRAASRRDPVTRRLARSPPRAYVGDCRYRDPPALVRERTMRVTDDAPAPAAAPAPPPDPAAILRSRGFVVLLVFAAIVGVIVSFAGWAFLELVHRTQVWVFTDLPDELGFSSTPSWGYLPVLGPRGMG